MKVRCGFAAIEFGFALRYVKRCIWGSLLLITIISQSEHHNYTHPLFVSRETNAFLYELSTFHFSLRPKLFHMKHCKVKTILL